MSLANQILFQKLQKQYYEGWGMWKDCPMIELWSKCWKVSKKENVQLENQEIYWKLNDENVVRIWRKIAKDKDAWKLTSEGGEGP
jgi:hypothetical protein